MRLLFLIVLLANVVAFSYLQYAEGRAGADAQIALLQINPEKMKLLKAGAAASASRREKAAAVPGTEACLEWSGFGADDVARAAAALAKFELGDKLVQRDTSDGYWVYIPPLKSKAEADKKTAELKSLGIGEFYVVQDSSQWRFAVSLGIFKTEEAAGNYLAQLKQKGVRSAVVRPRGTPSSVFVIRDPGDAIAAKIAELKSDFPNAQLKAAACADALAAKN